MFLFPLFVYEFYSFTHFRFHTKQFPEEKQLKQILFSMIQFVQFVSIIFISADYFYDFCFDYFDRLFFMIFVLISRFLILKKFIFTYTRKKKEFFYTCIFLLILFYFIFLLISNFTPNDPWNKNNKLFLFYNNSNCTFFFEYFYQFLIHLRFLIWFQDCLFKKILFYAYWKEYFLSFYLFPLSYKTIPQTITTHFSFCHQRFNLYMTPFCLFITLDHQASDFSYF